MFNAIRVNTDEHDERRGERECIDTDRTKDFPHGSRSLSRETPLFDPSLGSKRAHRTRTESERAKGARDVHLLTGDEKTVVLSRERFAADNGRPVRFVHRRLSLQNPSTTRTSRTFNHEPAGKKLRAKEIQIFRNRTLHSKSILSLGRRIRYCERKRFVFPEYKYKYYGFDILCY